VPADVGIRRFHYPSSESDINRISARAGGREDCAIPADEIGEETASLWESGTKKPIVDRDGVVSGNRETLVTQGGHVTMEEDCPDERALIQLDRSLIAATIKQRVTTKQESVASTHDTFARMQSRENIRRR